MQLAAETSVAQLRRVTRSGELSDFDLPAEEAAQHLLGAVLMQGETAGMIVETEAYLGGNDLASHAARGLTTRTAVLFGPPGRAYVYFIYGMYECLNVVVDKEGIPGCVLVRALAPLAGWETMRARRGWTGNICGLTNGPGKLTKALEITRRHYGMSLLDGPLSLRWPVERLSFAVERTNRIGISQCVDWPLRFIWAGHPCVSHVSGTKRQRINNS